MKLKKYLPDLLTTIFLLSIMPSIGLAQVPVAVDDTNYTAFDKTVPEDILANPDLVSTKYALASAAWFFNKNGLWAICDKGADQAIVTAVTKRVNGGTIGLPDRIKHFVEYYNLLK